MPEQKRRLVKVSLNTNFDSFKRAKFDVKSALFDTRSNGFESTVTSGVFSVTPFML